MGTRIYLSMSCRTSCDKNLSLSHIHTHINRYRPQGVLNRLLKGTTEEQQSEQNFVEEEAAKYFAVEASEGEWGQDSTSKIPSDRTKSNDKAVLKEEEEDVSFLRDMFTKKQQEKNNDAKIPNVKCDRCGCRHVEEFKYEMRCSSSRDGIIFKDTCVRFALVNFYKSLEESKQDKTPEERTEQIMQRLMANSMTLDNLLSALERKYNVTLLDVKRENRKKQQKKKADLGSFASMGIEFKSGTQIFHAADGDDEDEEDEEEEEEDDSEDVKHVEAVDVVQKKEDVKKPVTTTSTTKSTTQNSSNTTSSQNRNTSDVEQKMIRMFGDRVLRLMGLDNTDATNITMEQIAELRRSVPRHELESFVNEINREFPSLGVVLPSQDQVERDEEEDVSTPIMDRETQVSQDNDLPTQVFDSVEDPKSDTQGLIMDME